MKATADGVSGSKLISVSKLPAHTLSALSDETITYYYYNDKNILPEVTCTDGCELDLSWESANPSVATIENGVITIGGVGTTTISVTAVGNSTHSMAFEQYKLTVTPKVIDLLKAKAVNAEYTGDQFTGLGYDLSEVVIPELAQLTASYLELDGDLMLDLPTEVGTYRVRLEIFDEDGKYTAEPVTLEFRITPKTLEIGAVTVMGAAAAVKAIGVVAAAHLGKVAAAGAGTIAVKKAHDHVVDKAFQGLRKRASRWHMSILRKSSGFLPW